jgi:ribose-phosphate pyrophosphokinase
VRPVSAAPAHTRIHSFPDTQRFARALARLTGIAGTTVDVHHFPDGESRVRIRPPAGGHAVLVRSLHDPNAKLVETLLAADALRRAGAERVTLVAPYLPYMRQDTVFAAGDAISQRVIGAALGRSFDALWTIEAHLHRVRLLHQVVPTRGPARSLSAAPALAAWIRRAGRAAVVVGPDEESEPWVRAIARDAGTPWVVGEKTRLHDRVVRIRFPRLAAARRAVIIDDIASTGVTIAVAARALRRAGIARVDAAVVHAICAPGAVARIRAAGVRTLASCDTVPHPTNVIHTAALVCAALKGERAA